MMYVASLRFCVSLADLLPLAAWSFRIKLLSMATWLLGIMMRLEMKKDAPVLAESPIAVGASRS